MMHEFSKLVQHSATVTIRTLNKVDQGLAVVDWFLLVAKQSN